MPPQLSSSPIYPLPFPERPSILCSVRVPHIPYKTLDQPPPPQAWPGPRGGTTALVVWAELLGHSGPSQGGWVNE